ncbi:MAG: hypothetical protein Q8J80_00790 [Gallionella sp.]|nr:hypothetical protein [Gallionella sp.]
MKYLVLTLLAALLLWLVYIVITNRRKSPYDRGGDSGSSSGDSGGSSHCDSNGGCSGGDGGGGGD